MLSDCLLHHIARMPTLTLAIEWVVAVWLLTSRGLLSTGRRPSRGGLLPEHAGREGILHGLRLLLCLQKSVE